MTIDEGARASIPLRALWLPTAGGVLSILLVGVVMRYQMDALQTSFAALAAKNEQQGERINAQAVVIGAQSEKILALTDRVTDLSSMLRAYRGWPGEEPKR